MVDEHRVLLQSAEDWLIAEGSFGFVDAVIESAVIIVTEQESGRDIFIGPAIINDGVMESAGVAGNRKRAITLCDHLTDAAGLE